MGYRPSSCRSPANSDASSGGFPNFPPDENAGNPPQRRFHRHHEEQACEYCYNKPDQEQYKAGNES